MKKTKLEITSTPLLIPPQSFNMDIPGVNMDRTAGLESRKAKRKIGSVKTALGTSLPIMEVKDSPTQFHYWIPIGDRAIWWVQLSKSKPDWLPVRPVTQIALWKDRNYTFVEHLTQKMFFEFILKRNKSVMSDSMQTNDGRIFWQRRVVEALIRGINVAFLDFKTQEMVTIEHASELEELFKKSWGKRTFHKNYRWMIWL